MKLISLATLFQILPFIYSVAIDHREQFTAITSNYHVVDKHHEKYQLLGELREYCDVTSDCREFAYVCYKNRCECSEAYRSDEKNRTCVGGVGTKCQYDSHCIENAFCRHQLLCICKKEYRVISEDNLSCHGEWESKAAKIINIFMMQTILVCLVTLFF
ncbi:uncharacterized protein [Chironomus tepperi]|uniref:uncharacterized protein n=1 Tax=Chironomus tepperi TaxID=113505 RepID=UPI00391F8214